MAFAPFVPPWAALAVGAVAGLLTPLAVFTVDRLLRWDDPAAVLTVHGLGGALGLLALGIFADGKAGAGWNGVGADSYLGVAGQGVTGLLAAAGYQPDWPAQMQAQAVGLAALALPGFFVAWLLLAPPAILAHLLRSQPVAITSTAKSLTADSTPAGITAPATTETSIEALAPAVVAVDTPPVPFEIPQSTPEFDEMATAA